MESSDKSMGLLSSLKQPLSLIKNLTIEIAQLLRFYSRLSVPRLPFETNPHSVPDFTICVRMLPAAAIIIALPAAITISVGVALWLPSLIVATLAVMASILTTGGLHEDGLADTADGVGGGNSVERRLEIMRDSRIGSYGVLALLLCVILKIFAISTLIDHQGGTGAGLAIIAAAVISRVSGLVPHRFLPPARKDGRSDSVGRPDVLPILIATCLTILFCLVFLRGFGILRLLLSFVACLGVVFFICRWAKTKLGGHTGDIIGTTQQLSEVAFLVVLNASFHG